MQLGQERTDICNIITQANKATSNPVVFMYCTTQEVTVHKLSFVERQEMQQGAAYTRE
jgi:hypothetical protein